MTDAPPAVTDTGPAAQELTEVVAKLVAAARYHAEMLEQAKIQLRELPPGLYTHGGHTVLRVGFGGYRFSSHAARENLSEIECRAICAPRPDAATAREVQPAKSCPRTDTTSASSPPRNPSPCTPK